MFQALCLLLKHRASLCVTGGKAAACVTVEYQQNRRPPCMVYLAVKRVLRLKKEIRVRDHCLYACHFLSSWSTWMCFYLLLQNLPFNSRARARTHTHAQTHTHTHTRTDTPPPTKSAHAPRHTNTPTDRHPPNTYSVCMSVSVCVCVCACMRV